MSNQTIDTLQTIYHDLTIDQYIGLVSIAERYPYSILVLREVYSAIGKPKMRSFEDLVRCCMKANRDIRDLRNPNWGEA